MLGIALKLLGIAKAVFGWVLDLVKICVAFARRRPLVALALVVDVVLLYGCWWGYGQHRDSLDRGVKIVELKKDIKEKDNLIELLYKRVDQYVKALKVAQDGRVKDIEEHNKAVEALRKAGEEQLAKAQAEATRTKAERDYFLRLANKYHKTSPNCGTAEARIKCEQELNRQFIRDLQGAPKSR